MLLHLVDGTEEDVAESYRVVRGELDQYGGGLEAKPEVVALNKCDALVPEDIKAKLAALRAVAGEAKVFPLSGAAGIGLKDVLFALLEKIKASRDEQGVGPLAAAATGGVAKTGSWRPALDQDEAWDDAPEERARAADAAADDPEDDDDDDDGEEAGKE